MSAKKSWIFILLFSLSITILHGFLISHHEEILHDEISHSIDSDHDAMCHKCHCFHQSFTLNLSQLQLPIIPIFKPKFEQQDCILLSNTITLLKPPIS